MDVGAGAWWRDRGRAWGTSLGAFSSADILLFHSERSEECRVLWLRSALFPGASLRSGLRKERAQADSKALALSSIRGRPHPTLADSRRPLPRGEARIRGSFGSADFAQN